jgi:Fe-S cluster assembly protein SufD
MTIPRRDSYLTQLLQTLALPGDANPWLTALRTQARGFLQELTMPSSRDEEWRFTSLSGLLAQQFQLPSAASAIDATSIQAIALAQYLVVVNGRVDLTRSSIDSQSGLFVGNLAQAIEQHLPVGEYLGKQPGGEEVFTALNTSALQDATIIWVKGEITTPIQIIHIATGPDAIAQPRLLVVAENHSQAMIVEEYHSLGGDRTWTNSVAEIYLAAGTNLEHIRIQQENTASFHIGKTAVTQSRDSQYQGRTISWGGSLDRHHWEVCQIGPHTQTTLNTLAVVAGQQTADTHSKIALNYPQGKTNQLHKCIATGKGHGVFSGRVLVPQAAQQTDAAQLSRTLLLSPTARVDTQPQLEITADDVKCSHGATVSQLSPDELFYLQSRGLGADISRVLLVNAFALEVIDTISVAAIRDRLIQAIANFQP